ncbi:hypothetical protein ACP70R_010403 [Stipagrostis hirtigluma subsp. patula]
MANFAVQLKDKFLGLVERVAGCGGCGSTAGNKDAPPAPTKMPVVQQPVVIRSRDPNEDGGSKDRVR